MWSVRPTGLPATDGGERARLEKQLLILQVGIATLFCFGVLFGVFGPFESTRAWAVLWVGVYHVFHVAYVVRFRVPGRPLRLVEAVTPLFGISCITAGWAVVGDPVSPLWAVYLYALVGYARRWDGRAYGLTAGFVMVNVVIGRVIISRDTNEPPFDARLLTMCVLTGAMALLSNAIGGAWRRAERQARRLAETDPLTGIANRRTFLDQLTELSAEGSPVFSVLMLDLDDFKRLNDAHGHLFGDHVLVNVARTLTENIRPDDRIARYGGEEFVVAMPGTKLPDATATAERLRQAVADAAPTSISIGCAARRPGESAQSVLRRADDLLLDAKRTGKNTVRSTPLRKTA